MASAPKPASLRREIVLWYSLVLLFALGMFTGATYLLLNQALDRAGTASLRQTAQTVEQLSVPQQIPRIATREEMVRLGEGGVEALRRQTQLATGDVVEVVVTRSDDVEERALRSFLFIAALLIPLTAAAAAAGGRALVDRLLEPLSRLVQATREVEIGRLSRRVRVPERPAELQELARSVNAMLTRLERAVDALRNFTADASHELRTPLTSIQGTIQVTLARERSTEELEETLAEVAEEAEWMLHLVDGLLTLARGEEERSHHAGTPIDLVPLLVDACEIGQALTAGRPIEVRLDAPERLPVVAAAGPLRQVLINLVSNAAKFTERGTVTITGSEPEPGWAEVRVRDTGVGIDPEELPRVFDRFYRGEAARGQPGGTGLGLAIARLLVEQQGGRIEVDSIPGQGSEFRVRLPAPAPGRVLGGDADSNTPAV